MAVHLLICSLLLLVLQPVGLLAFPGGHGWDWTSGAMDMDAAQFMDFAYPLVEMSANAYRYPALLHSIAGWSLSSFVPPLNPSLGGVHGLVYQEISESDRHVYAEVSELNRDVHEEISELDRHVHLQKPYLPSDPWHVASSMAMTSPNRLIVAFRGTQMSTSIDSLADLCADKLLWEGFDISSLPSECSVFEPETLDYFAQALNYTLQVIRVYPGVPILLTGHSLGAGLAVLVAGALSQEHILPVIGFGAPATRKPLLDRGLSVNDSIITIAHEWDVIVRSQMEGQVGMLCLYPQEESFSCKKCLSSMASSMSSEGRNQGNSTREALETWQGNQGVDDSMRYSLKGGLDVVPQGYCMDCFLETHYLKNLIALVNQGVKPSCQQA